LQKGAEVPGTANLGGQSKTKGLSEKISRNEAGKRKGGEILRTFGANNGIQTVAERMAVRIQNAKNTVAEG